MLSVVLFPGVDSKYKVKQILLNVHPADCIQRFQLFVCKEREHEWFH